VITEVTISGGAAGAIGRTPFAPWAALLLGFCFGSGKSVENGIDSSPTMKLAWNNATGFGTPCGLTFIDAATAQEAGLRPGQGALPRTGGSPPLVSFDGTEQV